MRYEIQRDGEKWIVYDTEEGAPVNAPTTREACAELLSILSEFLAAALIRSEKFQLFS